MKSATLTTARPRLGFSFIEVLFAVMILGIGFIMIAGVFPVAISQTASTQSETLSASTVRNAVAAVGAVKGLQDDAKVPPTGWVTRLEDATNWNDVKGNQIVSDDPRFGWVPLLLRAPPDAAGRKPTIAELIVVTTAVRGRTAYSVSDLVQTNSGNTAKANLLAASARVLKLTEGGSSADTVQFDSAFSGPGLAAAAPGAVLVLANPNVIDVSGRSVAGRIYRLGARVSQDTFELMPGNDLVVEPGPNGKFDPDATTGKPTGDDLSQQVTSPVEAFVVGQAIDPANVAGGYQGGSTVTGVFVTYVPLSVP